MSIIINMHHYVELYDDPEGQLAKLMALWIKSDFTIVTFLKSYFLNL